MILTLHRLELAEQLGPGEIRPFQIEGRSLILVRCEKGHALTDSICPHAGTSLAGGGVVGNLLRCPNHGYMFDLQTGNCAMGRREGWGPLKVYPLQTIDGYLFVDL